jgi:hypothetical protein
MAVGSVGILDETQESSKFALKEGLISPPIVPWIAEDPSQRVGEPSLQGLEIQIVRAQQSPGEPSLQPTDAFNKAIPIYRDKMPKRLQHLKNEMQRDGRFKIVPKTKTTLLADKAFSDEAINYFISLLAILVILKVDLVPVLPPVFQKHLHAPSEISSATIYMSLLVRKTQNA